MSRNREYDFIKVKKFKDINLDDVFFDSLKSDYPGFEDWFYRKSEENAFIFENDDETIIAFMYLKIEDEAVVDVEPNLRAERRLKIGTMKINSHGTRMGERFIKKALDYAMKYDCNELYVTIFEKHAGLIRIFEKYGFSHHGNKVGSEERVYRKSFGSITGDVLIDYPQINKEKNKFILGIYPEFHTRLFPDSILNNESFDVIEDVSYTNSIHKVYLSGNPVTIMRPGDIVVIYRTTDRPGQARFRSVATSICVVEEVRRIRNFGDVGEFLSYCKPYSVYTEEELLTQFEIKKYVIKMTYNLALTRRLTNGLLRDLEIDSHYWGFFRLEDAGFDKILEYGGANERFVIN
ncbi:N-acetyltransferase [Paenibacillus sp. PK3_47]|uniref:GNAT family N-acetyltransferase n=1 Tax=Paenibacillus sp. PK3_47 TaxID=2072642 RepID=UPI00201E03EB|nr:GNAT family N-acetyltransferase [Paenibacillus sp. PK3_47]UQZ34583.1 N-acetyltransferase [Paenibacillus sp. PK3_47]